MKNFKSLFSKTCLMIALLAVLATGASARTLAAETTVASKTETASETTKERKANPNTQYGKAQQKLKDLGLYKGEVTGYKNPETTQALEAFQKQGNLKVTGTLSKETKDKLGIAPAAKKSDKEVNVQ